jgi:uroporphyrinogen-III synthase
MTDEQLLREANEALKLADNWLPLVPEKRLGSLLSRTQVIVIGRTVTAKLEERLLNE